GDHWPQSRLGVDLSLLRLGHRDAPRSGPTLEPRDLQRLMGLRVRIELEAVIGGVGGGPGEVGLDPIEVDGDRRRLELRDGRSYRRTGVCGRDAHATCTRSA